MANALTLTSFAENIFRARDIVAAEPSGLIKSVTVNSETDGVSINGTVNSLRTSEPTLNTSVTPAMTIPAADDQTIANDTMTLDKTANVRIPLRGEDIKKLTNVGQYQKAVDDMIAQAIRKVRNQVSSDVGVAIKNGSSRAVGTAGTTPFASNFNLIADLRKILVDNGTPDDGAWSLVLDTAAGTKLRQLANIYKVNEAGTDAALRKGALLDIFGFALREDAYIAAHTKGTGTSYLVNQSGLTNGSTAITVDTGSGTIVAGDILTFASGTGSGFNYVVGSALASNVVTLNRPGLRGNIADNNAITVGNDYTANVGFHRAAVELAIRPPADGNDAADDKMTVQDPVTGLVFEIALYKGYKMSMLDLTCYYGVKVWKPEFVATLLG